MLNGRMLIIYHKTLQTQKLSQYTTSYKDALSCSSCPASGTSILHACAELGSNTSHSYGCLGFLTFLQLLWFRLLWLIMWIVECRHWHCLHSFIPLWFFNHCRTCKVDWCCHWTVAAVRAKRLLDLLTCEQLMFTNNTRITQSVLMCPACQGCVATRTRYNPASLQGFQPPFSSWSVMHLIAKQGKLCLSLGGIAYWRALIFWR